MNRFPACCCLLLAAAAMLAQTPSAAHATRMDADTTRVAADSAGVAADSITWDQELDGIVVKAQRQFIKQELDRVGYDVQADAESKTQTVLDMLRKVPMVTVDGDDNILVRGNTNYRVYKNGHLDPNLTRNAKNVFKSMPAAMVKRIEVITDPGAREDAEGVDAILNIVMVDASRFGGITGVVIGYVSTLGNNNVYGSLTGQTGSLLLAADVGYTNISRRGTWTKTENERTFLDNDHLQLSDTENVSPGDAVFGNINASYDLDSLNLLSASFGGYFYKLNVNGDSYSMLLDDQLEPLYSYSNHFWMPGYSHHSWNGRLDYQHKTRRQGEQLTFSYMLALTRQHTDEETTYGDFLNAPFAYIGYLQKERERFTEHTFQLDWLRPLGKHHEVAVGAKYIDRNNNSENHQAFYGVDADSDTRFDHTTRVLSGYADYTYKADRWSARAGLRYEYSYMRGNYPDGPTPSFSHRLNDWVPQATIKWQMTDAQSLKFNFTTSIQRPGISYLNPAVVVSPTLIEQGNAQLVSARHHTLSLTYMYISPRLTLQLTPSYHFVRNGITGVQTARDDVRYETYDNVLRHRRVQLEQYVQWKPFDATTIVVNNNISYRYHRNPNLGYTNNGWTDNYYINLQQQLPWKLHLYLGTYGQIGHQPQDVYSVLHSWNGYYFTLQRSFLKDDRLTVRIGGNDVFSRLDDNGTSVVNGDFRALTTTTGRSCQFNLSVTYRFGSLKASVKKVDRSIENNDVVGGITKSQE